MTDGPKQTFHFGPFLYDIDKAFWYIRRAPRDTHTIDVTQWARALGLDKTPEQHRAENKIPLFDYAINEEHVQEVDLTEPLIFADVSNEGQEPAHLLIDGGHRLRRAVLDQVAQLPAYVLDREETLHIREVKFWH